MEMEKNQKELMSESLVLNLFYHSYSQNGLGKANIDVSFDVFFY